MRAQTLTLSLLASVLFALPIPAQTLLNVDFGAGDASAKSGFAATGRATNDYWNLYSHYKPRFLPSMATVANGALSKLKLSDNTESSVSIAVANAPGVWGNTTGDAMYDSYIFAPNGSNLTVTVTGLDAGRYHFYLYGHADPDATGEMNSVFRLRTAGTNFGPLTTFSSAGWKATQPWREEHQFVVFRDISVETGRPVLIEVAPGPNGVAVLNGLQISSRGSGAPRPAVPFTRLSAQAYTNVVFREVAYEGRVSDHEARFSVALDVESLTTNEISAPLFAGDVAVIPGVLPPELRVVRVAGQYRLVVSAPGSYQPRFEVVAKIKRVEPWNEIAFTGPAAAIASVTAQAAAGVELQLMSGAPVEAGKNGATAKVGDLSRIQGFLGQDHAVALRWQGRTAEVARKSLVTVDTSVSAQITPTVIKFTTLLRYELLQASVPRLVLSLPVGQALTRLQGEQIRDWNVRREGAAQILTVEFVKPVEKSYTLTLFSEQSVDATPFSASLSPPQPLEVERESGSFTLATDDVTVEVESATGLRQVNATAGAFAAYRFSGRPFALAVKLKRIEPVINVAARVTARLEETRLLLAHGLVLTVEKAGVYAAEFTPQSGFVVADVKGEGVDDWKVSDGRLRVSFAARVMGARRLEVYLEQPQKTFLTNFTVLPLRLTGAAKETAHLGAAGAAGIRLKTAELAGLREIPINQLAGRSDELLAFTADQPDWRVTLAAERLPARIVAEVFNLVTIGDGLVGGSATVRYGIINQGVQEFRVQVPAHWKNIEFTGPNIRRKDINRAAGATNSVEWIISLQDKAWGGYTLVVTYDHQFDPQKAMLDAAGLHTLGVERETGSVAITTAASLKLAPRPVADPLRVIDQTELSVTDRALVTRPVLLAYRYTGGAFVLQIDVTRHAEERVLDAVADRTQITSVLTDAGEMLTQAGFMVKNNDRQFQAFTLPPGANLWGAYVNNLPVKAERDGKQLLVSLPRGVNRDEAFAVDLVYAQKLDALKGGLWPQGVALVAPQTDVPNTYAEWQLYVPTTKRVTDFGGNMTVARGTTYELRDAWTRFLEFYGELWREYGAAILIIGFLGLLVVSMVVQGLRRGGSGLISVLLLFAIMGILAGMMLPALSKAKSKATRIKSVNNLKQIGLAVQVFAGDHDGRFPNNFEEMMNELGTDKILTDPDSNERYVYIGAGKQGLPEAIIAYSPVDINGRNVAFADGSVQQLSSAQFAEALQKDAQVMAQARTGGFNLAGGSRGGGSAPGSPPPPPPPPMPAGPVQQWGGDRAKAEEMDAVQRRGGLAGAAVYPDGSTAPVESAKKVDEWKRLSEEYRQAQQEVPKPMIATVTDGAGSAVSGVEYPNQAGRLATGSVSLSFNAGIGTTNAIRALDLQTDGRAHFSGVLAAGVGQTFTVAEKDSVLDSNSVRFSAPSAAGIRSIRIDIPRSGQEFTFTKVLNLSGEPLSVRMSVMSYSSFRTARSVVQLICFLTGLVLIWTQWRSDDRNSLWFAVGLALAFGAVGNLLISGRILHYAFITAVPAIIFVVFVFVVRRLWSKRRESQPSPEDGDHEGPPDISTAAVSVLLLLAPFATVSSFAQPLQSGPSAIPYRPSPVPGSISILSATYAGSIRERSAQFDATIQLQSMATNSQTIPLFGGDVAVAGFIVKSGSAKLVRDQAGVGLLLTNRGSVTLELKLVVKLGGDGARRQLDFALPPALASRLTATIDEPDADVEFPSAVSFQRTTAAQQTLVEAIIGASDRVEMQWTPRMKRIQDMEATVFSQGTTVVTLGGGVVNTRAVLDYTVAQGELRQAKVRLPAGQRLLRVEGEWIRTWEVVTEAGVETLFVDLLKGVSPGWRLTVETEKVLGPLPATVQIAVPHAMDIKRETGLVAVRGTEELALSVEGAAGLQRVDAAEFLRVSKESITDVNSAYRYLKADFTLTAKAEAVQPQIEAVVRNHLRVGAEQLHLSAVVDYTIKKAGVFALKLVVPPGWKIDSVMSDTGQRPAAPPAVAASVLPWTERTNGVNRELDIALKQRTTGAYSVIVELSQTVKEPPKSLAVPAVHPLGVEKLTGYVSVASEPGVSVKTETLDGLTEIPAAAIPVRIGFQPVQARIVGAQTSSLLAYKFITSSPGDAAAWKLSVVSEQVESWIRAEVVNLITVSETLVSGRALVRYDIANAPVKEFQLKVPAGGTNIEISGLNIRRRDSTGAVWRVELQAKVRGVQTLTVTWEQPRARTNSSLDLFGVEAVGVERETGNVAILARPPLQVLEKGASAELAKIDARELPEWAGVSTTASTGTGAASDAVVLAYRYLRPGFKLSVASKRFDEAELLQALVDDIKLTTVVADDGQVMTEMSLAVRNNGRQFLEFELPAGAKVWSAFVGGQPVRPSRQGGKLLLPLEKSGADEAAITVELVYVGTEKFPKGRGAVALASPTLDVPFKNARWELYLPRDYEFANYAGTMTHDAGESPVLQVFSAAAYGLLEAKNKAMTLSESARVVSRARVEISKGNLREANEALVQARRNNANNPADTDRSLKDLERELNRAQSSNLLKAQRDYSLFNSGINEPQQQAGASQWAGVLDAEAAEQQALKLQQQQEVAVANVQPLRVNLPAHGQKLTFTQVLQTETRKAMTLRFDARNTKTVSWFSRLLWSAGIFLALWLFAALLPQRRTN